MEKLNQESWNKIDDGLVCLMNQTDSLSDSDLMIKAKRLGHLSRFTLTLSKRVGDRLNEHVNQGSIEALFNSYMNERTQIDKNA